MTKDSPYPTSREIIYLLGMGTLLASTILIPGLGYVAKEALRIKQESDWQKSQKEWKKFNLRLLKRNLKRLHDQKVVELIDYKGQQVISLTKKGKTKFLKFKLEDISWESKNWDRKWRLVIYDIGKLKRKSQDRFRRLLKEMNFYPLQKSVYLTPYQCQNEIDYLREYFNLGEEVLLIEVNRLENEKLYVDYFGLS